MRVNIVLRYIGLVLVLNGGFMALAALIALLNGVDSSFSPLLLSSFITSIVGVFPLIFVRPDSNISNKEGYFIVILAWICCCLFGMLPYLLWGDEFNMINSWFESVSGYSTTGATILSNVEALPKGLVFFRSSTAFMGGLGVVVFMLLLLPTMKNLKLRLAKVELSNLSKDNFKYRLQQTAHIILGVYVGMTALEFFLLWIAGMSPFDAINHAFSNISTCGFSTKNHSILYYDNLAIEVIITVFMYLAGLHFGLIFLAVTGHPKPFFRSPIIRFYTISLIVGIIFIAFNLLLTHDQYDNFWEALRYSSFQVVSISSTTGFATDNTSTWSAFSILILIYFSFQCACSGSTTGGIKADRIVILLKGIKTQINKLQHPNAIIPTRLGNVTQENDAVMSIAMFVLLYIIIVFVVSIILSVMDIDMLSSFTASAASMGNVGPGFGVIGSLSNYTDFPVPAKFILSVTMLLGRLEIFSFFLIFSSKGWK
jgi:trk system potassium uptake protein TrkH